LSAIVILLQYLYLCDILPHTFSPVYVLLLESWTYCDLTGTEVAVLPGSHTICQNAHFARTSAPLSVNWTNARISKSPRTSDPLSVNWTNARISKSTKMQSQPFAILWFYNTIHQSLFGVVCPGYAYQVPSHCSSIVCYNFVKKKISKIQIKGRYEAYGRICCCRCLFLVLCVLCDPMQIGWNIQPKN